MLKATLDICDPRSTKHVLLDRFEKVKLSMEEPVERTRQKLEDLFKRAVPEASAETVEMFIARQLIKGAPEPWQLRLREADLSTVAEVEAKIHTLQDANRQERGETTMRRLPLVGVPKREGPACARCGLHGHRAEHCTTKCFVCGKEGHTRANCRPRRARRLVPWLEWPRKGAAAPKTAKPQEEVRDSPRDPPGEEGEGGEEPSNGGEPSQSLEEQVSGVESSQSLEEQASGGEPSHFLREQAAARRGLVLRPDANLEFKIVLGYRGRPVKCVVDTGCRYNTLRSDLYRELCPEVPIQACGVGMVCMNGSEMVVEGQIELEIEVDAKQFCLQWIVVRNATDPMLLGMEGATQMELVLSATVNRVSERAPIERGLAQLLETRHEVFSRDQLDVGVVDVQHKIPVTDQSPVYRKEYRVPVHYGERAREMLEQMVERELIVECESPWAAPAIFLEKEDKSLRLVVNYKDLNAKTVFDPFPIPDMHDIVRGLTKGAIFSKMDVRNSYWHIPMAAEDQEKTAFVALGRQYMFRVMPMGLKGAPATLTKALGRTLRQEVREGSAFIFYDDIVLATPPGPDQEERHLELLASVLGKLQQHGWKLNRKKCEFMVTNLEVLGHRVSHGQIAVKPSYVNEVETWPEPTSKKELQQFLGLVGFYSKFIQGYSEMAAPLTSLTGKGEFRFGAEERAAMASLKKALLSKPVLADYNPEHPVVLTTDASGGGWGAVLEQQGHPIEFASGKWNEAERKYSTSKRELKAVLNAVKKFHHYLAGAHFTIVTDHQAVEQGFKAGSDSELYRWSRKLDPYSFNIVHRVGTEIRHADALSRKPESSEMRRLKEVSEFRRLSQQDPVLRFVCAKLEGTDTEKPEGFAEEVRFFEDQLRRGNLSLDEGRLLLRVGEGHKVVVPRGMRGRVLGMAHSHPFAGHLGYKRTRERLTEQYYWYKSSEDVFEFIRRCLRCARNNVKRQAAKVSKKTVPIQGVPLAEWAMDVLGPLPKSEQGNLYILVITDLFTKWVEMYAIPDQKTPTIVSCLTDLICRYSIPATLLTDRGSNFMSYVFKKLMEDLQVEKLFTSPYHPQTDGQCERFNSTMLQGLRKLAEERPEQWDQKLQFVAFSYRTSKHAVTGYSPYELVFGKRPREPINTLDEAPGGEPRGYLENFKEADLWRVEAYERILHEKESRTEQVAQPPYEQGDLVMLKNNARKTKLSPLYRGPFKVLECADPNYVLDMDGEKKRVHGEHLKLFLRHRDSIQFDIGALRYGPTQDGSDSESEPVQFVSEITESADDEAPDGGGNRITRSGREVRPPQRFTE